MLASAITSLNTIIFVRDYTTAAHGASPDGDPGGHQQVIEAPRRVFEKLMLSADGFHEHHPHSKLAG
jgi:hypothetical protein